jgi:hypothetical protein
MLKTQTKQFESSNSEERDFDKIQNLVRIPDRLQAGRKHLMANQKRGIVKRWHTICLRLSVTTSLWTYTSYLTKHPIPDTYGITETPENSGLSPEADAAAIPLSSRNSTPEF